MKLKFLFIISGVTLLIGLNMSCGKSMGGKWKWVRSEGGFAGLTLTPKSEGYEKSVMINGSEYAEYKDDSLLFKIPYELQFKTDTFMGFDTVMRFQSEMALGYRMKKDTLVLAEICADCFTHYYVRE